jgi:superfamily II DNA or RNA helicase
MEITNGRTTPSVDKKREAIQIEAFTEWAENNKMGTVECITGLGKTFIAFRAMTSMPKNSNCLFLSESSVNLAA